MEYFYSLKFDDSAVFQRISNGIYQSVKAGVREPIQNAISSVENWSLEKQIEKLNVENPYEVIELPENLKNKVVKSKMVNLLNKTVIYYLICCTIPSSNSTT